MNIQARNLSVCAGRKSLITNLSLELQPGQVLAVVGPNGAGKSTLFRAICGDLRPKCGEVWLNGRKLSAVPAREQAQQRAVLPQSLSLDFAFRVLDVVLMGRSPHIDRTESQRDYEIARAALQEMLLEDFAPRLYTTLSGGEQQRVQLARVLSQIWEDPAPRPRYLLLDEPTNNLDLAHQHTILRTLRRLADSGIGVLAILHDLNLAAQYADHILVLKGGRALASGSPQAVLTAPTIEAAFAISTTVIAHPSLDCPLVISS